MSLFRICKSIAYKIPIIRHILENYYAVKRLQDDVHSLMHDMSGIKRVIMDSYPIPVGDHKMFLNPNDVGVTPGLFRDARIEKFETELIKTEIKNCHVVLDIGANVGYYTLIFAKLLGGQGKVFAFEPDEKNFDLLKKNIELNGYKNVTLVPKAVSNKTGKARLYLSEDNLGDHRIYDSHDSRHFIEIETVRLDDYFKDFEEKVDFIKMDVQGSEPLVLEGMQGLLDRNQELRVLSEYWPSGMKKCNRSSEEYLKSLKKNHFELYNINGINHRMKPCHISEILQEYKGDEDYTNLFCIRKQLKDCKVHTEEPEVG